MKKEIDKIFIRFAGDSGDGVQVTGQQFTQTCALFGNDVQTYPDFPAEIRAPAGTLPGVSGYQVGIASEPLYTPGDHVDVLIAFNPAALMSNYQEVCQGGLIIVNSDSFHEKEFKKINIQENPLTSGLLAAYQVIDIALTQQTLTAVKELGLSMSQARKCKNFYALGVVCWLFSRDIKAIQAWMQEKFAGHDDIIAANQAALVAGYHFAETAELFHQRYCVAAAPLPAGEYRHITGNEAIALGLVAAASRSQRQVLLSAYPITPASTILHSATAYADLGVQTFQAEDEIAAVCASLGAAYGGILAATCTSGPGLDLKSEGIGLAVMAELPLVIIDIQRAGPSTGMPTKTEQTDLLTALYGRHGECPLPVLAPAKPSECFHLLLQAFALAIRYMTPVIFLSDGYLANNSEAWRLPDIDELPDLQPNFATADKESFSAYERDPTTLARPWAIPGTENLCHRIGGLEKDIHSGDISYQAENHQQMVNLRANKIKGIVRDIPAPTVDGESSGDILVIGWGSTYGAITAAMEIVRNQGISASAVHIRYLHPLPKDLHGLMQRFKKILVVELNTGHLSRLLKAEYLLEVMTLNKVTGKPFLVEEIVEKIESL